MNKSNWIKHLLGLAKLEKNIGKKVAFESSADMIKNLEQELTTLKASLPKMKADAVRLAISECKYNGADGQGWESDLEQYANKLEVVE